MLSSVAARCVKHSNRIDSQQYDFWTEHYLIDKAIAEVVGSLFTHLRLSMILTDPAVLFLNLLIHSITIFLHQLAIAQAEKSALPAAMIAESEIRCSSAALEIANIVKLTHQLKVFKVSYNHDLPIKDQSLTFRLRRSTHI